MKKSAEQRDQEPVEVRIGLPLPADIAKTLIEVIGFTYPSTMIAKDPDSEYRPRSLVLHIDQGDRHKSPKARKKYDKLRSLADGWVGDLTALGPDGVSMSPNEMLIAEWTFLARESFNMFPDADNYLETQVYDPEVNQSYVFTLRRRQGKTPHELRQEAEAQVAELETEVTQLKRQLKEAKKSVPRKRPAASAKRSAGSSTTTKSAGRGGTRKAAPSSRSAPQADQ